MKFIFIDLEPNNIKIFQEVFNGIDNSLAQFEFKKVKPGFIKNGYADCIVSPANSFGLMDGGVDLEINESLNYIDESLVRPQIKLQFFGEQPIGSCLLLKTHCSNYHYLAHTPTMRIPEDVSGTDIPYSAFRTLLITLLNHNKKLKNNKSNDKTNDRVIETILITPFCTGAGKIDPLTSARLMRLAYDNICTKNFANKKTSKELWMDAQDIDRKIKEIIKK